MERYFKSEKKGLVTNVSALGQGQLKVDPLA